MEQLLSFDGPLNVRNRDFLFLGQAMRENGNLASVKEIEPPVLDMPLPDAQLVNAIPQLIRRRPPEFVSKLSQKLNPGTTIRPCPFIGSQDFLEPT